MDEIQIDNFIEGIQAEMEILRGMEKQDVSLTVEQENAIKKLPKSKREKRKEKYLNKARTEKKERMRLLLCALEDKIKASGLPPEAKKALEKVMQQAKDNGWKLSPQNVGKVEEIKEAEMAEKEPEKKQAANVANADIDVAATIALTGAVVATAAAVTAPVEKIAIIPPPVFTPKTKTIQNVGGTFMLPDNKENMNPKYVKTSKSVGKKALTQLKMGNKKDISIQKIKADTSLLPIQKRYAEAMAFELRPDIKQDKLTEDRMIKTIAIQKSLARYERKKAKREGRTVQGVQKRPDWDKKEALVMKRVNRIKQRAGFALSMDEVKEKLGHPTLIRIYEARMRKDHPEYFAEQNKYAAKQEQIAKLRAIRRAYRKDHQKNSLTQTLENMQEHTPQKSIQVAAKEKTHKGKPKNKTLQAAIRAHSIQNARKKIA